eukprot:CAMPEP_0183722982 /NCGR_PEP_ID=MMETSP0737-20130205/14755_1 /TAXON_ID=385413 /ORGANISM="Thalassiosira miniscula, Strain CCMP1093" /LENGTH=336 /DNA_ID=CAMNT_0025953231 /DNA_START=55 /DNA_END=1065 /DNA_ORIENTATION=-
MDHNTTTTAASSATAPSSAATITTNNANTKTIYLIRHGVAHHNVPDPRTGERPNLRDPRYTDPSLIRQGEMQARVLGEQFRRRGLLYFRNEEDAVTPCESSMEVDQGRGHDFGSHDVNQSSNDSSIARQQASLSQTQPIELVVCSPLTRCLQTASYIFPSYFERGDASTSIPAEKQFSTKTTKQTIGSAVHVLDASCKVCCHGDVREAYGMHYPDKRSPLSQLKANFPNVAYHPSLMEHDTDWQPNTRETRKDVSQRIQTFFAWLAQQPQHNIAIVTHGVWMECALLGYYPEVLEFGKKRVYNCEVYRGELSLAKNDGSSAGVALKNVEQISFYHA